MWWSRSNRSRASQRLALALVAVLWLPAAAGGGEVRIDIQKAPSRKIRVAVPEFFARQEKPVEMSGLREVLARDLAFSGFFAVADDLPGDLELREDAMERREAAFETLSGRSVELLVNVFGAEDDGKLLLEAFVFDTSSRRRLFGKRYRGPKGSPVKITHVLAGEIIRELTGVEPITTSRIAFLSDTSGAKQVFVADYDGRNAVPVSPGGELALFPAWTPDNRGLVYTYFATGFPELIYRDVDRDHRTVLASYPGMNATVSFAPDGKEFLVTLSKDGNPEIYKLDLRGRLVQRMTFSQAVDTSPSYAPDGGRFAFVSDRSGTPQIYTLNSRGGTPVRLTYGGHYNVSPDWSPDGKHIAYSSIVSGRYEIMLISPEGGEAVRVTDGPGSKEDPSWGPDGRHLVFTLTKGYQSDLFNVDVYTKETTRITREKGNCTSPSWSFVRP